MPILSKAKPCIEYGYPKHKISVRYLANSDLVGRMKPIFPDFFQELDAFVIKRNRDSLISQVDQLIKCCIDNIKKSEKSKKRRSKTVIEERAENDLRAWEDLYQELLVL